MAMETDREIWGNTPKQMLGLQPEETWVRNSKLDPNSITGFQIPKYVCELPTAGLQSEQVKTPEKMGRSNGLQPEQVQARLETQKVKISDMSVRLQSEHIQPSRQTMGLQSEEVEPSKQSCGLPLEELELQLEMNKHKDPVYPSAEKTVDMRRNQLWNQSPDKNNESQPDEDSDNDCYIVEPEPSEIQIVDLEKEHELQDQHDHHDLPCNLPQSSTTRELVIAAISVMKSRKARPDTKRLCNWVSRKYSRTVNDVVTQIDTLCEEGILAKVEYKGSISFRIVSEKKMHKRAGRRKNSELVAGAVSLMKPKKIQKKKRESPHKSSPLTISMLLREHFIENGVEKREMIDKNEIIEAIQESNRTINKKGVMRELEALLAQENHLGYLIKESNDQYSLPEVKSDKVLKGTIAVKVAKERQKSAQKKMEMEAELLLEKVKKEREEESRMEAAKTEDEKKDDLIKEILISNKLTQLKSKMRAAHIKLKSHNLPTMRAKTKFGPQDEKTLLTKNYSLDTLEHRRRKRVDWSITNIRDRKRSIEKVEEKTLEDKIEKNALEENVEEKTPEEKMDEKAQEAIRSALIAESTAKTVKIRKDKSKSKKKSMRTKRLKQRTDNAKIPKPKEDIMNPVPGCSTVDVPKRDTAKVKEADLNKTPEYSTGDVPMPDVIPSRVTSSRKKRARQIFDPADHDIPGRILKRMRRSASPPEPVIPDETKVEAREVIPVESKKPVAKTKQKEPVCIQCDLGVKPKNEKLEKLLFCKDCTVAVHPVCLNFTEHLTGRVHLQPWQCKGCKTCTMCLQSTDEDSMLFCNSCDLGYHMACHVPPISKKPEDRWECSPCAAETGFTSQSTLPDQEDGPQDLASLFLPLLPPQPPGVLPCFPGRSFPLSHYPSPEVLPANWHNLPVVPQIPDITGWSSTRVYKYLVHNGVKDTTAKVFIDQDYDGNSVKAMERFWFLSSMKEVGLKLGPSIKLYQQIRKLQTRRNL